MNLSHLVIVTGLSGSGRTTAIRALEDAGFFCIDNLPLPLLDTFLFLAKDHDQVRRVALGVDVREKTFLAHFSEVLGRVRALGQPVDVLFLDTQDEELLRRFSATRRRHPLESEAGSLSEAILQERRLLEPIREQATWVIDTTDLNVHRLKSLIQGTWGGPRREMGILLTSFSYRNGVPREADYVLDCRGLPNPFFEDALRPLTGRDAPVREWLQGRPEWSATRQRIEDLLATTLPLHEAEGRPVLTVAFGCTGGQHRSVAMAEEVAEGLRRTGRTVTLNHRELP